MPEVTIGPNCLQAATQPTSLVSPSTAATCGRLRALDKELDIYIHIYIYIKYTPIYIYIHIFISYIYICISANGDLYYGPDFLSNSHAEVS